MMIRLDWNRYDAGVKVDKVWLSFIAFAKNASEKKIRREKIWNFIVYYFDFEMLMFENEMEIWILHFFGDFKNFYDDLVEN